MRPYGITSQTAIYRCKRLCRLISLSNTTCSSLRIGHVPAVIGWCSPITALPHACLPVRWWIRFAAGTTIKCFRGCRPTGKPRRLKQPTGLFLRATFRIHHHLPPKQKKDIPFGMSFCFGGRWWIRTTEVIDDRFTVWSNPAECLMISGVFPYYSLVHLLSFHCFQGKNLTRLLSS